MSKMILEEVRDELRACGVVKTEAEFCTDWLGRSECYLRTLRHTRTQPSANVLSACASKLGHYADRLGQSTARQHEAWSQTFRRLSDACWRELLQAAEQRWQQPDRAAQ